MAKILYIGFGGLMEKVGSRLSVNTDVSFVEIMQLSSDVQENLLADGDVFLIGPYTINPVRQIQRANKQNPLISIVLLIFPAQFQKVKQDVQLAYNVGKYITYVPYELGKDISTVFDNAILRTKQRRSFSRINEQPSYPKKEENTTLTFNNISAFLEHAPIGAIVFDQKKKIITANQKAREIFYPILKNPSTSHWCDLFPEEFVKFPEENIQSTQEHVQDIIRVNNQFMEINVSALAGEEDQPHYLLLMNDVTEKIKTENLLKNKIDELEFLNGELDDFINVISHDFKTPLTSISLLTELGMMETTPEKQSHFFKLIKNSADKLKELLKGLNVLVDIKKTRAEKIEVVDFQKRLDIILPEFSMIIKDTGATIKTNFTEAPLMSYLTAHIDSFFSNLVTNALKYQRADVPLIIDIRSSRTKEYIILSIKDNGSGIDLAKNLNKLFQPFKRLTDHGTGSGLGLSIIKRLIEKNQGYLEVFSQPGEGTEFKAYLKNLADFQ